jgi:hypothetical protein
MHKQEDVGDFEIRRGLCKIDDGERKRLLTPQRAARLRTLYRAGRLVDYRLDGPAVAGWIEQQQQALIDGARFRRMAQEHQARTSAPRRVLPVAGRLGQRQREHRPQAGRVARRGSRRGGDPPQPEDDPDDIDRMRTVARESGFVHISEFIEDLLGQWAA